jgi:photosystem II stability/assembly factor-like uncharacterized protein
MKHCKSIPLILCAVCVISGYSQEWEKITPTFNPSGIYNIYLGDFINKDVGWSVSQYGRIWRTQDGGLTWEMQKDSNRVSINDIEFVDSLCGWISGITFSDEIPFLWSTIDGGNSWNYILMPDTANAGPFVINFNNSLEGFAGGWNNAFYYTDSGGKDWEDITNGEILFGALYDIFFIDSLFGWAVGESGEVIDAGVIINTIDGGQSWQIQLPETLILKAVYFSNNQHGCAVGSNVWWQGVILVTDDGGENWQDMYFPYGFFNDVVFTNDSTGWVVGDYGFIWFTDDGGQTWTQVESGTYVDLNRIVFVDNGNIGYIFGEDNTLLKYDRNGNSVEEDNFLTPSQFKLNQNYPNPFNAQTVILYNIEKTDNATLNIYDLKGREVITLLNEKICSGSHQVVWNGKDKYGNEVSSGIYFYVLQTGLNSQVRKMILLH